MLVGLLLLITTFCCCYCCWYLLLNNNKPLSYRKQNQSCNHNRNHNHNHHYHRRTNSSKQQFVRVYVQFLLLLFLLLSLIRIIVGDSSSDCSHSWSKKGTIVYTTKNHNRRLWCRNCDIINIILVGGGDSSSNNSGDCFGKDSLTQQQQQRQRQRQGQRQGQRQRQRQGQQQQQQQQQWNHQQQRQEKEQQKQQMHPHYSLKKLTVQKQYQQQNQRRQRRLSLSSLVSLFSSIKFSQQQRRYRFCSRSLWNYQVYYKHHYYHNLPYCFIPTRREVSSSSLVLSSVIPSSSSSSSTSSSATISMLPSSSMTPIHNNHNHQHHDDHHPHDEIAATKTEPTLSISSSILSSTPLPDNTIQMSLPTTNSCNSRSRSGSSSSRIITKETNKDIAIAAIVTKIVLDFAIELTSSTITSSCTNNSNNNSNNNNIQNEFTLEQIKVQKQKKQEQQYDILIKECVTILEWFHRRIVAVSEEKETIMNNNNNNNNKQGEGIGNEYIHASYHSTMYKGVDENNVATQQEQQEHQLHQLVHYVLRISELLKELTPIKSSFANTTGGISSSSSSTTTAAATITSTTTTKNSAKISKNHKYMARKQMQDLANELLFYSSSMIHHQASSSSSPPSDKAKRDQSNKSSTTSNSMMSSLKKVKHTTLEPLSISPEPLSSQTDVRRTIAIPNIVSFSAILSALAVQEEEVEVESLPTNHIIDDDPITMRVKTQPHTLNNSNNYDSNISNTSNSNNNEIAKCRSVVSAMTFELEKVWYQHIGDKNNNDTIAYDILEDDTIEGYDVDHDDNNECKRNRLANIVVSTLLKHSLEGRGETRQISQVQLVEGAGSSKTISAPTTFTDMTIKTSDGDGDVAKIDSSIEIGFKNNIDVYSIRNEDVRTVATKTAALQMIDMHIVTSISKAFHLDYATATETTIHAAANVIQTRLQSLLYCKSSSYDNDLHTNNNIKNNNGDNDECNNDSAMDDSGVDQTQAFDTFSNPYPKMNHGNDNNNFNKRTIDIPSTLALAGQFCPWQFISPISLLDIAIQNNLWHGAERIVSATIERCSRLEQIRISSTSRRVSVRTNINTSRMTRDEVVLALIDGTIDSRLYRSADAYATQFLAMCSSNGSIGSNGRIGRSSEVPNNGVDGEGCETDDDPASSPNSFSIPSRFLRARYLHACSTIVNVIRKRCIPVIERQVLRIDDAVEQVQNIIWKSTNSNIASLEQNMINSKMLIRPPSDGFDNDDNLLDDGGQHYRSDVRTFALRQLEESGDVDSAQRLAQTWGMEYLYNEGTVLEALERRRAKYLQWDDVFVYTQPNPPDLVSTPQDLFDAFVRIGFLAGTPKTEHDHDDDLKHDVAHAGRSWMERYTMIAPDHPVVYGFDVEWGDEGTGADLLQISTSKVAILIDIPALTKTAAGADALEMTVGRLFTCPGIIVTGFSCRQDVARLRSSYSPPRPVQLTNVNNNNAYNSRYEEEGTITRGSKNFQDQNRHWFVGASSVHDVQVDIVRDQPSLKGLGLSRCCEYYVGKPLDKSEQCSLWNRRPLSKEQRIYAALDAYVCVTIYEKLRNSG